MNRKIDEFLLRVKIRLLYKPSPVIVFRINTASLDSVFWASIFLAAIFLLRIVLLIIKLKGINNIQHLKFIAGCFIYFYTDPYGHRVNASSFRHYNNVSNISFTDSPTVLPAVSITVRGISHCS